MADPDFKPRYDEAHERFRIAQEWAEFQHVYAMIRKRHPRFVLELGCYRAGWIYAIAPACAKCAKLVSIDNDPQWRRDRREVRDALAQEHKHFRWHLGDSRDHTIVSAVRAGMLLLDVLHIDGDHDPNACREDWDNFAPMVRPGGLIIIHDIAGEPGAKRLWEEMSPRYPRKQRWLAERALPMGTGVLIP